MKCDSIEQAMVITQDLLATFLERKAARDEADRLYKQVCQAIRGLDEVEAEMEPGPLTYRIRCTELRRFSEARLAEILGSQQAKNLKKLMPVSLSCYRRDQIPACTFARCLELQPDYSLRRAEDGGLIPFLDPVDIPLDDREFTAWYRAHVRRFFGLDAEAPDAPFSLHDLEHKTSNGLPSFDALACDGGSCYLKCSRPPDGSWEILSSSMRGHGPSSKEALQGWMLETYPGDLMDTLPPITQDRILLKPGEAKERARRYLKRGFAPIVVPLGYHDRKVSSHKPIRPSTFVCRDPRQWKAWERQLRRLDEATGCGPEVLALRRGYAGRDEGSLVAIATAIYERMKSGDREFSKWMHPARLSEAIDQMAVVRRAEASGLRAEAWDDLLRRIEVDGLDTDSLTAAILCTSAEAGWLD
jgi:hypothetical protein